MLFISVFINISIYYVYERFMHYHVLHFGAAGLTGIEQTRNHRPLTDINMGLRPLLCTFSSCNRALSIISVPPQRTIILWLALQLTDTDKGACVKSAADCGEVWFVWWK